MRKKVCRKSDGELERIDRIIERVLATGKVGGSAQLAEIWTHWREIVGDDIAEHCTPQKLNGGKLYLKVDNPVWVQQLDLMKEEVRCKINEKIASEKVDRLLFRTQ